MGSLITLAIFLLLGFLSDADVNRKASNHTDHYMADKYRNWRK